MAAPHDPDCKPLHIPWPEEADQGDPAKMAENWRALMQWSSYLVKNCLCENCGGSS